MQVEGENVSELGRGKRGAISIEGPTVGRQIHEGDTLYTFVPEDDYKRLVELKKLIPADEYSALEETASIMRRQKPSWGMVWGGAGE